jgi:hypothetical protein
LVSEVQPTLTDLYQTIEQVTKERGYDQQVTANIRSGLQTRLASLMVGGKGLMFNTRNSISFDTLHSKPTILEFSALGDDEEKTFVLGAVLIRHRKLSLNARVVLVPGVHFAKSFCAKFYYANMQTSNQLWILAGKVCGNMESHTPKPPMFRGCRCPTQPIVFS